MFSVYCVCILGRRWRCTAGRSEWRQCARVFSRARDVGSSSATITRVAKRWLTIFSSWLIWLTKRAAGTAATTHRIDCVRIALAAS